MASVDSSVYDRYAAAAQQFEPALCCAVQYSKDLLANIPDEVIERDYGCGDPSPFVRPGDTVLDLGSGGGKLCFIAAQLVGRDGNVIGVDCNREMLALARRNAPLVAQRIGYENVEFLDGKIQNLQPLIASESIDCALSNCVLNLVKLDDRRQLFSELFRVIKPGGRIAISDIVCDQDVPDHLRNDSQHWSGCISGAYREDRFLEAFADAGFQGIEIAKRSLQPWQTIEGIEFRSLTVLAYKRNAVTGSLGILSTASECCGDEGKCC